MTFETAFGDAVPEGGVLAEGLSEDGAVIEAAPAKINLSLHVTGQRADGYHLLDSVVLFTQLGDSLRVEPAETLSLRIDGPFARDLSAQEDNLVLRAARAFGCDKGAEMTLTKNLPVASGMGGGSADAAATLRALATLWDLPLPDLNAQMKLGADVAVCMTRELTRMRGIGEDLERFGPAPILDLLLVNPGVSVATKDVFQGLRSKTNAPMPASMPDPFDTPDWLAWLHAQRNDLQDPACEIAPVIREVLDALAVQQGCVLSRMSGSGATCFAIFEDPVSRDAAAQALRSAHPDWWISETDEAAM